MAEVIAKKNYYSKDGILLLAKGTKTSEATIEKLTKLGSYEVEDSDVNDVKENTDTLPFAQALGERMKIRNDYLIEYPNKILSSVIFTSKTKPWWMFVNSLSNYIDWIYTHSIDVAIISLMIAVELRFKDEDLWNIGVGAFLHDVGKLLIPSHILQKPGPLDEIETISIQQHCELGATALKPYYLPTDCADIIMQHHERLDGSGYPKGLRGTQISRNAKIVMIADVVDAITSGRPYRPLRGMEEAIKMLKEDNEKYPKEYISILEKIIT